MKCFRKTRWSLSPAPFRRKVLAWFHERERLNEFEIISFKKAKSKIAENWASTPIEPVDFSFRELTRIEDIGTEEPRSGRRKPIVIEQTLENDEELDGDGEHETKRVTVQVPKIERSATPSKADAQKTITTAIRLSNNKFKNMRGFQKAIELVLEEPDQLAFIDLSFNEISEIDESLFTFSQVGVLYLHANSIEKLSEIDKLVNLPNLRALTLHGNPVENIKGYRQYVVSRLPNLRHLDFCAVTKQDRMLANIWKERHPTNKPRRDF